ncbi:hypothetical protein T11_3590 [Trichinella zimbabwensis]|uniref:KRAB-A domain-containing protein 2 n=1 Tax=Trichinella zimbabwensis TaxID=268475 RepID=A0A0V1GE56_9BILA|nr:hypothetical protein T11_3590 [Trichinella zimbabwensis]
MRKKWIAQNKEILHKTAQLHRILHGYLLHQNGIVFDESLQYPLIYRNLAKYYNKG